MGGGGSFGGGLGGVDGPIQRQNLFVTCCFLINMSKFLKVGEASLCLYT